MAGLVLTYETFNNLLLLGFFDEGSTRDSSKEQRRENFVKANKRETFYKLGADLLISYDFIRNSTVYCSWFAFTFIHGLFVSIDNLMPLFSVKLFG